jgi:hypothetical protein
MIIVAFPVAFLLFIAIALFWNGTAFLVAAGRSEHEAKEAVRAKCERYGVKQ